MLFVRQLAPAQKLELFKRIKGYYFFEGGASGWNTSYFKPILDEKAIDVYNALDYDPIDYFEYYSMYTNGR